MLSQGNQEPLTQNVARLEQPECEIYHLVSEGAVLLNTFMIVRTKCQTQTQLSYARKCWKVSKAGEFSVLPNCPTVTICLRLPMLDD